MLSVLPENVKRSIRREYLTRLFALALLGAAAGMGSVAVFLIPAYVVVRSDWQQLSERAKVMEVTAESQAAMQETVMEVKDVIAVFGTEGKFASVLPLVEAVAQARPEGVRLSGFSFDRGEKVVHVEGVADTRGALVAYKEALEDLPMFAAIDLPISELARGENIDFTLEAALEGE